MTQVPKLGEESLEQNEDLLIGMVVAQTLEAMKAHYGDGKGTKFLHDAHPKSHGMMRAKFIVGEAPTELRHGLFRQARQL